MQLIINIVLFIVAVVLYVFASPINLILVLSNGGTISGYLLSTATTIDKVAGWEFRTLWKKILINEEGVGFDDIRFTMSYHLGVNKELGTLTSFGKFICDVLHFLDHNHVEKAVEQVRRDYGVPY